MQVFQTTLSDVTRGLNDLSKVSTDPQPWCGLHSLRQKQDVVFVPFQRRHNKAVDKRKMWVSSGGHEQDGSICGFSQDLEIIFLNKLIMQLCTIKVGCNKNLFFVCFHVWSGVLLEEFRNEIITGMNISTCPVVAFCVVRSCSWLLLLLLPLLLLGWHVPANNHITHRDPHSNFLMTSLPSLLPPPPGSLSQPSAPPHPTLCRQTWTRGLEVLIIQC